MGQKGCYRIEQWADRIGRQLVDTRNTSAALPRTPWSWPVLACELWFISRWISSVMYYSLLKYKQIHRCWQQMVSWSSNCLFIVFIFRTSVHIFWIRFVIYMFWVSWGETAPWTCMNMNDFSWAKLYNSYWFISDIFLPIKCTTSFKIGSHYDSG